MLNQIKTPEEIKSMRQAGSILARGLELMAEAAGVGVNTKELSDIAAEYIRDCGASPAFLNYPGSGGAKPFSEVACISVNDAVVHGLPGEGKILVSGDLVSLDLGVAVNNMIVDGAITIGVGNVSREDEKLLKTTKKALGEGLKQVNAGCFTGGIGNAIEQVLSSGGYGIVRDLVGHGVGYSVHEDPNIPNYGRKNTGSQLLAGMTVAIEPMATRGTHEIFVDNDGWTVRTRDGSRAAHFEHTVLVTDNGCEILTAKI